MLRCPAPVCVCGLGTPVQPGPTRTPPRFTSLPTHMHTPHAATCWMIDKDMLRQSVAIDRCACRPGLTA